MIKDDYIALALISEEFYPNLGEILNRNGAANLTVCPECGVDDFAHESNCALLKSLDNIELL